MVWGFWFCFLKHGYSVVWLIDKALLSTLNCLNTFVKKINWLYMCGSISIFSRHQFAYAYANCLDYCNLPHYLDYSNFTVNFEIRQCKSNVSWFFLKRLNSIVMAIPDPLAFHLNFRISWSISVKKPYGILGGFVLVW